MIRGAVHKIFGPNDLQMRPACHFAKRRVYTRNLMADEVGGCSDVRRNSGYLRLHFGDHSFNGFDDRRDLGLQFSVFDFDPRNTIANGDQKSDKNRRFGSTQRLRIFRHK
jgi:hypothetical protein